MPNKALEILSETEFQCVKLMVDDCLGRKEIAEKVCRSEDTVSTHQKNIYRKLRITKVTELSKIYYTGSLFTLIIIICLHGHVDVQYRRSRRCREVEYYYHPTQNTEES